MGKRVRTIRRPLPVACVLVAVMLVALFAAVPLASAKVVARNVAATTGSDQYDPDIDGAKVVYTSNAAGNNDVYLYNLTTKARQRLTTSVADQSKAEISGDNVVYLDSSSGTPQVACYTISTGQTKVLTSGTAKYEVAISGNTVVYVAQSATPNAYDVVAVGLASGPALKLGTYPMNKPYDVDVAGNHAVYSVRPNNEDDDSGQMSVYLANIGSGTAKVIGKGDSAAVTADGTAVYSRSYGDYDPLLMKYDPITQTETVLFEGWADPLGISDGRVLLRDEQALSVYHLATGTRLKIAKPKNLYYQLNGGISGKWVVWETARKSTSTGYVWAPNSAGHLMDYDVRAGKFSGAMLKLSCPGVAYGKRAVIKGRATTISGGSYKGRVTLQRSSNAKKWVTVKTKTTTAGGSFTTTTGTVKKPTYFRGKFKKGSTRSTSYYIKVVPHAIVSAPVLAAEVAANQPLSITGTVRPALTGIGASFRFERKAADGTWVDANPLYAVVTLTPHTGYFGCSATSTFATPGQYRAWLVAGYPDKGLAYGSSSYSFFTVK